MRKKNIGKRVNLVLDPISWQIVKEKAEADFSNTTATINKLLKQTK